MKQGMPVGSIYRASRHPLVFTFAIILLLLCFPVPSRAIQLRWSSGATELTFSSATRCTLVVQADSSEQRLPSEWRLLWAADSSCSILPLALDPEAACLEEIAQVAEVVAPATPADSAANQTIAHFCSEGSDAASIAYFILDLPAGSSGKLKVVAIDPTDPDSSRVVQSQEVTFNGGVADPYPPVVLNSSSAHHYGKLTVMMRGTGLAGTEGMTLVAADTSWRYPLRILTRSDLFVTATAQIAAPLPACFVEAATDAGHSVSGTLPPDNFPPLDPQTCSSYFYGSTDTTGLQPKDFAFVYTGDQWHIFYTRQYTETEYTSPNDYPNTRAIGHAKSTALDLGTWTVVAPAIRAREGRIWDNLHVWAPTVVLKGITYYMFYTGVQLDTLQTIPELKTTQIQRIGVATSVNLDDWTQDANPVYFNKKVPWALQDSSLGLVQLPERHVLRRRVAVPRPVCHG
jgi:hypothetical protein